MSELVRYDQACKALAEAKSVDEAKELRDKSEAMRAYAKQANNKQLEVDAAEIRLRAERRLGELIQAQKETVGLNRGGGEKGVGRHGKQCGTDEEPHSATPTLAAVGIEKKLSSRAQKLASVPESDFEGMLDDWRERVSQENERVTTNLVRRGEREQRNAEKETPKPPAGTYQVLYADPPWQYDYSKSDNREIENQYPTLSVDAICNLPISEIADDNAVLFLWTTSPKLREAFKVLDAWGFDYKTCAVWDKERVGMGYYYRQQHELLLVATKGAPGTPDPANRPSSVLREKRDLRHSAKPKTVVDQIDAMYPESAKIELFARAPRDGWDAWGNEADAA